MAWVTEPDCKISEITAKFPDGLESDYVDPILGRSLVEHLKSYWLVKQMHGYSDGYEANKVKAYLEPEKFTERDWLTIAKVCGFGKSWAFRQIEDFGGN
ncbi:hypothetical protein IFO70_10235 [Phormidium tenue FACHB-886]|nr:hypothetical protein [Phormidium tenue FACHB-886]